MREGERTSAPEATARAYPATVALLLLGSGFCAWVLLLSGFSLLNAVFGASTAASSTILTVMLGSWGLGGVFLGRRADRASSPLGLYTALALGLAAAAAASPLLATAARAISASLGSVVELGPLVGRVLQLALSTLVVGLPSFLIGGTLPVMARAAQPFAAPHRSPIVSLAAFQLFGAAIGAGMTVFFAFEQLGIRATLLLTVVLQGCLALVARRFAHSMPSRTTPWPALRLQDRQEPLDGVASPTGRPLPAWTTCTAATATGFVFLLLERVWHRLLAPLLGATSSVQGLILIVTLIGLSLGAWFYALGSPTRRQTSGLATPFALAAGLVLLPWALGDRIAILAMVLRPVGDAGFAALATTWLLLTSLVVLPATTVFGYVMARLIELRTGGDRAAGHETGSVYAWWTAGGIAGSMAASFALLPLLSAPRTWQIAGALLVALALGASWVDRRCAERSLAGSTAIAVIAAVFIVGLFGNLPWFKGGPGALWRHSPIGAGNMPARFDGPNRLRQVLRERQRSIVWQREGVESGVSLIATSHQRLMIDGQPGEIALRDAPSTVMSALIGAALHPFPRHALVLGLESGQAAGWLARVPTLEQVDVVEREPAIRDAAAEFAPANLDVLEQPKVNILIRDGRELLRHTDAHYDLIVSQAASPHRADVARTFSRELYQAAEARLRPGGLFLQWLHGKHFNATLLASVYATMGAVFPSVETWQVHENDLLLVASREPIAHDLPRLDALLATDPFDRALDQLWGLEGATGLYAGYLAGPTVAAELADVHRHRVETDDRPRMAFAFARALGRARTLDIAPLAQLARAHGASRPPNLGTEVFWQRTEEGRTARQIAWGDSRASASSSSPEQIARNRARRAYREGDLQQALLAWSSQPHPAESPRDRLLLAEASAELSNVQTPAMLEGLGPHRTLEGLALRARWRWRLGDAAAATDALGQLFTRVREDPWIDPAVLTRVLSLVEEIAAEQPAHGIALFEQLDQPFAVRLLEDRRLRTRLDLASALNETQPDATRCVRAFEPFEPHVPWEDGFLHDRSRCYVEADHRHTDRARAELERYLAEAPPRLERGLVSTDPDARVVEP